MRDFKTNIIRRFDRTLKETSVLVIPVIHLNGDSRERLVEYRQDVLEHLRKAQSAMVENLGPHMRNFYLHPQGDSLYKRAFDKQRERLIAIHNLIADIEYEMIAIDDDNFTGDGVTGE